MKHFTVNQKISCIGLTGKEINLKSINFALVSSSGEILVELGYKAITQEEDSLQFIVHILNSRTQHHVKDWEYKDEQV